MISNLFGSNYIYILIGTIIALFGLVIAIFGTFTLMKLTKRMTSRVENFVMPNVPSPSSPVIKSIIQREITGSLLSRTIIKWIKKILQNLGKFTPEKMAIDIEHKLGIAGNPANMHAGEFYAIRFLVFITGIILAVLINRDFRNTNLTSMMLGLVITFIGFALPDIWLKGRIRTRQDEIRRGLPDALDMLSVCASAGLGFDQSLQKVSSYWETELGQELKRVTHEMEMGVTRAAALRNLSKRLEVDDLARFVAIIIQAEKVGMSYADVLHSQALQMRVQRQFRAREIANKLPGKMILPIALLIFPAMLAVILGPSIPILMNLF